MDAAPGVGGLLGHVSPKFKLAGMRDTDNVRVFFQELDEYEKNFDSTDANKRLPNVVIMSLPEDHTAGTRPGGFTPRAMVANADHAVGQLVERITKSPYWAKTAMFIIEDDAPSVWWSARTPSANSSIPRFIPPQPCCAPSNSCSACPR
jgi:hypothetical protein